MQSHPELQSCVVLKSAKKKKKKDVCVNLKTKKVLISFRQRESVVRDVRVNKNTVCLGKVENEANEMLDFCFVLTLLLLEHLALIPLFRAV